VEKIDRRYDNSCTLRG